MPLSKSKVLGQIRKTIKKYNMVSPSETVVIGVSGGADSLGLLYILNELEEYDLKLIVSHLNHGIRGKEAKKDAEFVEQAAEKLNLPFELQEADAPGLKKRSGLSLEEAGRELRYKFFKEVLHKYGAQKVATGHTLNDQAETMLMRLVKGSGPLGLSGIPPVSEGHIIRPLIEMPKSEIEDYLKSKGISWIEDSTNKSKLILRNRIRHELIPELEKYNPKIKETLSRTANIFRVEVDFIESRAQNWIDYVFKPRDEGELLGILSRYKTIPEALRLAALRIVIKKTKGNLRKISFNHISSIDELLFSENTSGEISLPDDLVVAKGYDLFFVGTKSQLKRQFSHKIPGTGKWNFPHLEIEIDITEPESFGEDKSVAFFEAGSVEFPIEIRNFHPGDRFMPLGMKRFKKVKSFLIDEKMPRYIRNRIPLFLSKGEI
ncbi:MAG: tRNA lysidine(34) synthetase TilS, partial [Thermodesulfobacteriota bacterium]